MRSDATMPRPGAGWRAASWAVLAFLHVPLALIVLYAFSAEEKSYVFPPPALTARWFGVALQREDVWAAIRLSFDLRIQAADAPRDERFFGPDPIGITGRGYAELNGAKPLGESWHQR